MISNSLRSSRYLLVAGTLFSIGWGVAHAEDGVFIRAPTQIQWTDNQSGPQAVPLHADPAYRVVTKRVRIPENTDLPPHGHASGYRLVTVISGTLLLGFGESFDDAKLKEMPPGSVFSEPAGHKHFARTRGEAVVLQLTEIAPPAGK